jgi:hypothetical protein
MVWRISYDSVNLILYAFFQAPSESNTVSSLTIEQFDTYQQALDRIAELGLVPSDDCDMPVVETK